MLTNFPNIRVGLKVGIAGGAPTDKNDIRLGDVVVGAPSLGNSGVVQYDFGKDIQDEEFFITGHLNKPPPLLLNAIGVLESDHELDGNGLQEQIEAIIERKPNLARNNYQRPASANDKLYRSDVVHRGTNDASCATACSQDPRDLVVRKERVWERDSPVVHYGLVASANKLVRNAELRDYYAHKMGVMCFDMEAAGLVNHFPCLTIHGICNYSDTHKNNTWQGYAAIAAAAYAYQLLSRIAPDTVETTRQMVDMMDSLRKS